MGGPPSLKLRRVNSCSQSAEALAKADRDKPGHDVIFYQRQSGGAPISLRQKLLHMSHKHVELIMVRPMSCAFDGGELGVFEMGDASVGGRIRGPGFRA